jgi:hypothetical protein
MTQGDTLTLELQRPSRPHTRRMGFAGTGMLELESNGSDSMDDDMDEDELLEVRLLLWAERDGGVFCSPPPCSLTGVRLFVRFLPGCAIRG